MIPKLVECGDTFSDNHYVFDRKIKEQIKYYINSKCNKKNNYSDKTVTEYRGVS